MSREEAIKELSNLIFELGFEDNVDDKVYALNMAIQALSQEPCENKSIMNDTELDKAIRHIKTRADAWAVKEVTEALRSISERLDKALSQESLDNMPCVTKEEMQKCKEVVKKYTPSVTQKPIECTDAVSRDTVLDAIFDYWYKKNIIGGSGRDVYDDCAFIIKQLPSVTPKPTECDDTISREAVKKVLSNHFEKHYYDYCDVLEEDIDKLPPVTPQTECLKAQTKKQAMPMSCDDCCYEPNSPFCEMYRKDICEKKEEQKSGKWIPNYYFYGIYDYTCSECEKHSKERSAFCPNCGCRMESEE